MALGSNVVSRGFVPDKKTQKILKHFEDVEVKADSGYKMLTQVLSSSQISDRTSGHFLWGSE